jgi:hypothetical protein
MANLTAGTLAGTVTYADGAFRFTGTSGQQLTFTKNAATDNIFNGGGTIMMLVRPRVVSSGNRILATTQNGSGALGWRLRLVQGASGGYSVFFARATSGLSGQWRTYDQVSEEDPRPDDGSYAGSRPMRNGSALMIAVTYDDGDIANDPTIYIQGQPFRTGDGLQEVNTPTGAATSDATNPLQIGYDLFTDSVPEADLCPFLMFDRVLTATEVAQVTNVFVARIGTVIGRTGENFGAAGDQVAGQKVTIRAGFAPTGTGAVFGGTLALLGGDVWASGNSDAGGVLLRGGDKVSSGQGSGGPVTIQGGFGSSGNPGQGGSVLVACGDTRGNSDGSDLTLNGGDQTGTGNAGRAIMRAGDATAAGSSNNSGGVLSLRSGGYRVGLGGGSPSPGNVYVRSGGPLFSGAGGGITGGITIYTGRDAKGTDVAQDFAGAGCDTGDIVITTGDPGPNADIAGDIFITGGNTTNSDNIGDPGDVFISAGDNLKGTVTNPGFDGGSVSIAGGDSNATGASGSGNGGDIFIDAGDQTGADNNNGRGGDVLVTGGDTQGNESAERGGDIELLSGATGSGARDGEIRLRTPSTKSAIGKRTGGFSDTAVKTKTVGALRVIGIGATMDLVNTDVVVNDGDGVKVVARAMGIDATTFTEVVDTVVEQSFYRTGGTLTPLTAQRNNQVTNGTAWGVDGSFSLVVVGSSVTVRMTNASGSTGYSVNVAVWLEYQPLVQA